MRDMLFLLQTLRRGLLPPFVYGEDYLFGPAVFIYHRVSADKLAGDLRYLAENGYRLLTPDELAQSVRGERHFSGREALLSFDDGFADLASVAEPILRGYGAAATAFIAPAMIGRPGYLSRESLRALAQSPVFTIGSHSYHHARIFVSGRIVSFRRSGEVPPGEDCFVVRDGENSLLSRDTADGRPLYETASRLCDRPRYLEDENLTRSCQDFVASGTEAGMSAASMNRGLLKICRDYSARYGDGGRVEAPEEQEAFMLWELSASRRFLEEETGRPVESFCLPWNEGGGLVRRLCPRVGYSTCFAGYIDGNRSNAPGSDPFGLCRLNADFIPLLPGSRRASLASVLAGKAARRLPIKRRRF